MTDIKLVIKIPEGVYKTIMNNRYIYDEDVEEIALSIIGGTPLPKGHGDLKDTEKLKNAFIAWSMVVHGNFTDADIASIIYNSPTTIEADKAESDK